MNRKSVRKQREGVVVSDAMDKTVVVRVERRFHHPVYGKVIRQHAKHYAHDEKNEARKGDVVRIQEVRPLSRLKRWRLLEIIRRGGVTAPVEST
ncbi:MAG: 30S ribosomal protein S17 [Verrucomicrobia bacterium]|nr:30S ribosomal protein S17 [Verrucomicrobiota bacterium]